MSNKWGIPSGIEALVRKRDTDCVYCHVVFKNNSRDKATWEHIDNDENSICKENIVLCCFSCNRSKSQKSLVEWLESDSCKKKNITKSNVSKVVKDFLNSRK